MSKQNIFLLVVCVVALLLIITLLTLGILIKKERGKKVANLISLLIAFNIVAIVIDVLILFPLYFSKTFWEDKSSLSYEDYHSLNVKNMFDKDDVTLYFYSYNCFYCEEIKTDVLSCYSGDTSFYLINIDQNKDDLNFTFDSESNCIASGGVINENNTCSIILPDYKNKMIGVNDYKDFYLCGTPTLVKIKERMIYEIYVGTEDILSVL